MKSLQQAIVGIVVLLFACSVQAEEAHEAAKVGLPQLDPALYPAQIFWLVISFGLTYLLISRLALPLVQKTQANRHEVIQSDLGAAAKASEQAKVLEANYEKALAEARTRAHATISDMAVAMTKEATSQQASQQQELNRRVGEAEEKIIATSKAAAGDLQKSATELAQSIAEKISGIKVGASR